MFKLDIQVLWRGQPNDLFIEGITSNALASETEDEQQTRTFPSLRPTPAFLPNNPTPAFLPNNPLPAFPSLRPTPAFPSLRPTPPFPSLRPTPSFPSLRPTPAFLPNNPTPAFLPSRPSGACFLPDVRAYSRADAIAAVEEVLLAAPHAGAAWELTVVPGQLAFVQKLPDASTTIEIPIYSGGLIHQADLVAAGVQTRFNLYQLDGPKPVLLRRLGDQGFQLTTSSGENHLHGYTEVIIRAEPEHLCVSLCLSAGEDGLPRLLQKDEDAREDSSADGQPDWANPAKILPVKTRR